MKERKVGKIVAVILAVTVTVAVVIHFIIPPRDVSYSKRIYPGQTYLAWDGNPPPSGYAFRAIYYDMYNNGSVVYGSGIAQSSWTCPEYVYGQEGNPSFKVDYAVVWTDGYIPSSSPS
ncbi:MAG: hypothetical protein ABSD73_05430 [Candidatus Bathyarchaeia archaeon]|jgi:hypothetical protein